MDMHLIYLSLAAPVPLLDDEDLWSMDVTDYTDGREILNRF